MEREGGIKSVSGNILDLLQLYFTPEKSPYLSMIARAAVRESEASCRYRRGLSAYNDMPSTKGSNIKLHTVSEE